MDITVSPGATLDAVQQALHQRDWSALGQLARKKPASVIKTLQDAQVMSSASGHHHPKALAALAEALLRMGAHQEAGRALYLASRALGDVARLPLPLQTTLLLHHPLWHEDARGRRLCFARPAERHRAFLIDTLSDPEFRHQYNAFLEPAPEAAQAYIDRVNKPVTQVQQINWVIESIDGRQHGLATIAKLNLMQRTGELIVGFPQGQRTARRTGEAFLMVMSLAFRDLRLRKLNSVVYADNPLSQDLTIRSGFTQEGYLREQLLLPGQHKAMDLYLNGCLAKDYFANSWLAQHASHLMAGVDLNRLFDPQRTTANTPASASAST